jgi:hypothetical protein
MSTADVLEEMPILRRWAYRTLASDSDEVEKELCSDGHRTHSRSGSQRDSLKEALNAVSCFVHMKMLPDPETMTDG